jgi:uncharacterized membrane protein
MTDHTISVNKKLKLHFFLLIAAIIIGTLVNGPSLSSMSLGKWIASGLSIALIACVPLFFFMPTILKPTAGGLSWYGFLLLAYVLWSVVALLSPSGLIGGILILGFSLSNFVYVILWLRPFKKAYKAKQKAEKH